MPDDENQAGTTDSTASNATDNQTSQAPTQEDVDRLTAALNKEREASKKAQAGEKAARLELEKLGNSGKSDLDKIAAEREAWQRKVDTLTAKARTANGKEAVRNAAKEAGAPDTDLIYRLVRSDISFDDDDEPDNVADLIAGARKEFPDLFKVKPGKVDSGGDGAKGKPSSKGTMNDWIRDQARRPA